MKDVQSSRRGRTWLGALLRLAVFAALLGAAGWLLDLGELGALFAELSAAVVAWFLLWNAVSRGIAAIRWRLISDVLFERPGSVGLAFLLRVGLVAEFVNIWVPSFVGGEVVRVVYLKDRSSVGRVAASVVIDRAVGFLGVFGASSLFAWPLLKQLSSLSLPWTTFVVVSGVVAGVSALVGWLVRKRLARAWSSLAVLKEFTPSVPQAVAILACGVSGALVLAAAHLPVFWAIHPIPWTDASAIVLFARFGRLVPVSVLGVNSVEAFTVLLGELYSVPGEVLGVLVAVNLLQKAVFSLLGAVIEVAVSGTDFLVRLREGK